MAYIICDIDGTIANNEERVRAFISGDADFSRFYAAAEQDVPILPMAKLLETVVEGLYQTSNDYPILYFVTGRPRRYARQTAEWLEKRTGWIVEEGSTLLMSDDDERRQDYEVKRDHLERLVAEHGQLPFVVFDDRQSCVDMYREAGCFVCQVGKGDY